MKKSLGSLAMPHPLHTAKFYRYYRGKTPPPAGSDWHDYRKHKRGPRSRRRSLSNAIYYGRRGYKL